MSLKNEITIKDWFENPKELVAKMNSNDALVMYDMITLLGDKVSKDALRPKILASTLNKLEYVLPNGQKREVQISRGGITTKTIKTKTIDFDKAIKFAQENNLELPMTERIVIEPQIDKSKIESMMWFQENADKFVVEKEEVKETKSYDRIIGKYVKE